MFLSKHECHNLHTPAPPAKTKTPTCKCINSFSILDFLKLTVENTCSVIPRGVLGKVKCSSLVDIFWNNFIPFHSTLPVLKEETMLPVKRIHVNKTKQNKTKQNKSETYA